MKWLSGVFLCLLLWCPAFVWACPDPMRVPAEMQAATGRDLWSPNVYAARAGGDRALSICGFGHRGYVRAAPDFSFELSRLARYDRVLFRANAECDTVLLLRDARGRWFFDDDSGTGRTASISIADPPDGRYSVWVGTYQPGGCPARLTLESF